MTEGSVRLQPDRALLSCDAAHIGDEVPERGANHPPDSLAGLSA